MALSDNQYINFKNYAYRNVTSIRIGQNVQVHNTDFSNKFGRRDHLQYLDFPIKQVTNMSNVAEKCWNLTGNILCGPNVINMSCAYSGCNNLTGTPVCGPNVTNMDYTYFNCTNLTGNPVCGDKVTNMDSTYRQCTNLTGKPVCGNNVTSMHMAYHKCTNLTGGPVCGPNVINMAMAYSNIKEFLGGGNGYFYSNNVKYAYDCFDCKSNNYRINIYIHDNSETFNTFYNNKNCYNTNLPLGYNIIWSRSHSYLGNNYDLEVWEYYNGVLNIALCKVKNVTQARLLNGD